MNLSPFLSQMTANAERIRLFTEGVSDEQARWKPEAEAWSILEVINHLLDEEREDFRVRLDIMLHKATEPLPPIDPQGWVTARKYNERDLAESVNHFLAEREKTLTWLRGLVAPNFEAVYTSPFGSMSAGDMFAAMVAHDLLHLRQLVELHWAYTAKQLAPYQGEYAGDW
ncbi:MAG: DinB family protein [Anaerolineales bacterium]|nr:DinB family protein [Anaerolineales bacterium]